MRVQQKPKQRKKKPRKNPYPKPKSWRLVRALGEGIGLWRCQQTGQMKRAPIKKRVWLKWHDAPYLSILALVRFFSVEKIEEFDALRGDAWHR